MDVNMLLNNRKVTEDIKRGNQKNTLKQMAMKTGQFKPMECSKEKVERDVYSNTTLPQEIREPSTNLTLYVKQTRKRRTKENKLLIKSYN